MWSFFLRCLGTGDWCRLPCEACRGVAVACAEHKVVPASHASPHLRVSRRLVRKVPGGGTVCSGEFFRVTTEGALTAAEGPPSSLCAEPVLRTILPSNVTYRPFYCGRVGISVCVYFVELKQTLPKSTTPCLGQTEASAAGTPLLLGSLRGCVV